MDCGAHAVKFEPVHRFPVVSVRLGQKQIPGSIQGVHLKFVIGLGVGIRVNKDLKIVVIEDDAVMLQQMGPDLISLQ